MKYLPPSSLLSYPSSRFRLVHHWFSGFQNSIVHQFKLLVVQNLDERPMYRPGCSALMAYYLRPSNFQNVAAAYYPFDLGASDGVICHLEYDEIDKLIYFDYPVRMAAVAPGSA